MTRGVVYASLLFALLLGAQPSAVADENPEVGAGPGWFETEAQQEVEAAESASPTPMIEGIASNASSAGGGETIAYSSAPACEATGSALCGDYFQCTDGSVATLWTAVSEERGPLGSYTQCPEDPAPTEPNAPPALPALTPGRILQAFRQVPLPESTITVQPPGGETLVNFETIYSTEAEPFTETVRLLGRRVTLDITPATFTWRHGDGTTQTTDWAGRPWTKGMSQQQVVAELIHHVYTRKGKDIPASVDTVWTARYRVDDGPWADVGGTVTMTGSPVTLDVLEARPVLTAG